MAGWSMDNPPEGGGGVAIFVPLHMVEMCQVLDHQALCNFCSIEGNLL